ncbi:hypothetical protein [Shimia sp.]|uniref:hypothetical protein n=1 Tax=Shimia sp. TaxID=1954381 RepID=UPI003BACF98E
MDRRVRLWSIAVCVAAIVSGFWLWLSPNEETDDQLAVETYRALDLSIEALEVLLGEDLEASSTYAVDWIKGMGPNDSRESRLEKLVKWFDPVGLEAMNIIFYDADYPKNYWKVAFPGCQPRTCVALLRNVEFSLVQEAEWQKYFAGHHKEKMRSINFGPKLVGSSTYYAEVDVDFDFAGRSTKVDLFVSRDFSSETERLGSTLTNGGPTERRQIYQRRKILADAGNALSEDG